MVNKLGDIVRLESGNGRMERSHAPDFMLS